MNCPYSSNCQHRSIPGATLATKQELQEKLGWRAGFHLSHSPSFLLRRQWGMGVLLSLLVSLLAACTGAPLLVQPAPGGLPVAATARELPRPGAGSLGDPYYPWMGNGGYDALHYTLDLTVNGVATPAVTLTATVTLVAEATHGLRSFNLDFAGFVIEELMVNGMPARYGRSGRELMILPAVALPAGERFTVTVAYHGTPAPQADPAVPFAGIGWLPMDSGVYVLNQPSGASTWFPVNDHPLDKATYTYRVNVPKPYVVAANGILQARIDQGATTTYLWEARDPMVSYLTTLAIARLEEQSEQGPGGLLIRNYFPVDAPPDVRAPFAQTIPQLEFFSEIFGPYPFEVYGSLVMDEDFPGALETQTLPVYGRLILLAMGERVLAHELAHQWIGNSVSIKGWQDIWINEGLATYADWLWVGRRQGEGARTQLIREAYAQLAPEESAGAHPLKPSLEGLQSMHAAAARLPARYAPPGRVPVDELFGTSVYQRGALTFAALHAAWGDEIFFRFLRTYATRYQGGNAGTHDLIAVAEEVSGEEMGPFFEAWLFEDELPAIPELGLGN
jgi:aminopeptidase N